MGKLRKFYWVFLLFVMSFLIFSCEKDKVDISTFGSVTGIVLDGENNLPIQNASVSTNPPSVAVLTDEEGKFIISSVESGDVSITVKKEAYSTTSISVLVKNNQNTDVTIILDKSDGPTGADVLIGNPKPSDKTTEMPLTVDLRWQLLEDAGFDSIKYDVMLYESENLIGQLIASELNDTTVKAEGLEFQKTYFWQVIVKNEGTELNRTTVWSFSTIELPDLPFFYAQKVKGSYEIFNSDSIVNDTLAPKVQLTDDPAYTQWFPQLNPTKTLVSFISNKNVDPYIYTMRRDGSDETRVLGYPVLGYHNQGEGYCWSPNGQFLLYGHYEKLKRTDIYTLQSFDVAIAPEGRHFRQCDWNAYTNKIVVQTMGEKIYDSEIYIMNADGSDMTLLVENLPGRVDYPTFNIDGSQVMFTHDVSGYNSLDGRQLDSHIFLIDSDSTGLVDISFNKPDGTNDLYPRFDATGAYVVFVNTDNTGTGQKDIYVMDRGGIKRFLVVKDADTPFLN